MTSQIAGDRLSDRQSLAISNALALLNLALLGLEHSQPEQARVAILTAIESLEKLAVEGAVSTKAAV